MIIHNDISDLSVAAHALKSLLNIKFTRAKERHASAMGFASSNHLLAALKEKPIEREFEQYIEVLKSEALANHQITIDDDLVERLRFELID
jgi:Arc/MetJ family transcription regulator